MGQSLENVPGRKCLSEQPSAEYENFSENGAKSGSGVIYTLIYQNENGMSYMQG